MNASFDRLKNPPNGPAVTETDVRLWLEIRRGLLLIAHALHRRYNWPGLVILLTGKDNV